MIRLRNYFNKRTIMPNVQNHYHQLVAHISVDFKGLQSITGELSQVQIDSINAILSEMLKHGVTLKTQQAYILATAWHESRFQPIKEWGGEAYLKGKRYWPYYGRGFVQLTWDYNYKAQGERLGIDLIGNPDLALNADIAADILVYGMAHGSFTGRKLSNYIHSGKTDFPGARRVINGTDKAALIAGIASKFMEYIVSFP